MEQLKPCPFCGEEAQIFTDDEMGYLGNAQYLVRCGNCLCGTGHYNNPEYAIEAWNKRAKQRGGREMLIRSQNREVLINLNSMAGTEIAEGPIKTIITSYITGCSYLLGEYSNKAKAMKVLDMIQEAYGDSEYTKYVIPEVCRMLSMKPKTEENKAHAGELGEMLKKGMTFQMPEDSEVEV